MKTIEENNRMIAEFMGLTVDNGIVFKDDNTGDFHSIKYHTSWEWLMPVVGKCDTISFYENSNKNVLDKKWGEIFNDQDVVRSFQTNEIATIYNAVVQFIEWYNENKLV